MNAVYGQRSGVRLDGKVAYRVWAVPQAIYIDHDVLAVCPPALSWSGIGDILCFHPGVLDWRCTEREGMIEEK
ncbi:MAG: iron-containing alcohol dehydrogenase [Rhodospirillaceae bacterium]|nr:iron-containing alcohol dehydrogenase [Rhodospirillaceae bacterium]